MQHCCKNFSYQFELERVKRISRRKLKRQKRLESYVNPIIRALEYKQLMKEEELNQSQLAEKLGISRVRITQILSLLKLPKKKQDYILKQGKEKMITERKLRKGILKLSGIVT